MTDTLFTVADIMITAAISAMFADVSSTTAGTTITLVGDPKGTSPIGSNITLSGAIHAKSMSLSTGSSNGYAFVINKLPSGVPITVTGAFTSGAGTDSLAVQGTASADNFVVSPTQVSFNPGLTSAETVTYAKITVLGLAGLAGNDSYTVNASGLPAVTTITTGNGNNSLVLNATLLMGVAVPNAQVNFDAGGGVNTAQVNATTAADTLTLSGESYPTNTGDLAGAGLLLHFEKTSQFTLNTLGGGDTVYVTGVTAQTLIQMQGTSLTRSNSAAPPRRRRLEPSLDSCNRSPSRAMAWTS